MCGDSIMFYIVHLKPPGVTMNEIVWLKIKCRVNLYQLKVTNGSLLQFSVKKSRRSEYKPTILSVVNLPDAVVSTHAYPNTCPVCNSPTKLTSDGCKCTGGLKCLPQLANHIWYVII